MNKLLFGYFNKRPSYIVLTKSKRAENIPIESDPGNAGVEN